MRIAHYYIIIIILLSILVILGVKNNKTHTRLDKQNFSISDTLSINQIILENRNLEKITLKRIAQHNYWSLNDSLIANKYSIDLILKTIKEMRVKQPIARAALNNIIKRMAIQNTKVDVFCNGKLEKTYYISGETPDQLGTFMMLKNAIEPYIMHIPGFNGYLSSRFSCKENLWRSKKIFNIRQIDNVQYRIPKSEKNQYILIPNQKINKIYCESFLNQNQILNFHDIINREAFLEIKIIKKTGKHDVLKCIRKKPVNKLKYKEHKYDRERFYAFINNQLMLVQYNQLHSMLINESIKKNVLPWLKINQ